MPTSAAQTPAVLIVEGEPAARKALCRLVESCGYAPAPVETVADALAATGPWKLAVVTSALPDGDGLTVLRHLRSHHRATRTIFLATPFTSELQDDARQLGAELVLPKPVPVVRLLEWLRRP